jgi:5-methylcytosine-specific restriction enzyme subunit McrC
MPPAAPTRTLVLTERVPLVCRLAPADVNFLLDAHRGHLRVTPTRRRHRYRLVAAGRVGVVVTPGCRLVIRPKVPLASLFFMLDPDAPLPADADAVTAETGGEVLNFLAGQLARRMAERAAAGLHCGYAERAECGPLLQGRLDVAAQLREPRKEQLHSRYDDFTADLPCNRLPRAAAEAALASPFVGDAARAALGRALAGFAGVTPDPAAAVPGRLPSGYGPLLDLARLLLDGLRPGEASGPTPAPAFLLDLECVFERYVASGVSDALGGDVQVQPLVPVTRPAAGRPDVVMRPDLVIERGGRTACVADTKWKRLRRAGPEPADLYQVIAYAAAFAAGRVVLVFPGRRDRARRYELAAADVAVEVRTLRVVGPGAACRRSLGRLARALGG